MVSTNISQMQNGKPSKANKKSGKRGKAPAEQLSLDEIVEAAQRGAEATPPAGPPSTVARTPVKVSAARAAARICGLADVSESLDVRRQLRRLARQIEKGSYDAQHMAFLETAISDCLEDASATAGDRQRWLLCEAATWGLAWMARTRRAGGSAGGLLERLVKAARSAQPALAEGDTLAARSVLTLARLFCDIEACRCLERDAATALTAEIDRLVSAEGVVNLRGSAAVVERVARWCSVRDVAQATGSVAWDAVTEKLLVKSVATTLRLLGGQGRLLVGAGRMPAAFSDPVLAVAADGGHKRVRQTAEAMQKSSRLSKSVRLKKHENNRDDTPDDNPDKLLPRDLHDATAAVAIIRSGWERNEIRVMLAYRDAVPYLEIAVGDRLLVEGPWQWRASKGGQPLEAEGPWTLSCWESDQKATYLEIIAPLAGGLQLDRQIVLLPQDRIVLLADAITQRSDDRTGDALPEPLRSHANSGLRIQSLLPLAASLEREQADETREILIYDTKPRLMVLPLSLPEWKSAGRGSFTATPEGLAIDHQTAGSRCYAPLWLDFDPERQGRPLTWRQLTVADTRQNLPPQQAVGFRVQVGLDQWLVYRTLDEARNRTVLGCNISCGFVAGRIDKTGVVDRAIEID